MLRFFSAVANPLAQNARFLLRKPMCAVLASLVSCNQLEQLVPLFNREMTMMTLRRRSFLAGAGALATAPAAVFGQAPRIFNLKRAVDSSCS
jgi:hypothetical protein